jgi:hypothetical protein
VSDKIIINPEVTELITVTRRDSRVVVSSPGTPGPAGQPGTTDYNALNNKPDLTQYATQTYVNTAITNIVDGAPGVLDTLNELAAAISDDSSFASTITTSLGNKQDKVSGVSDTEIGYLDGVTSAIQTQLNGKSATGHTHTASNVTDFTEAAQDAVGNAVGNGLSYNDSTGAVSVDTLIIATQEYVDNTIGGAVVDQSILAGDGISWNTGTSQFDVDTTTIQARVTDVSDTEISYLNGVTSGIQTQLDSKIAKSDITAKGAILVGTGSGTYTSQTVGTNGQVLTANSAQTDGVEWTTIPSGFGWTYIGAVNSTSGTTVTFSGLGGLYKELLLTFNGVTISSNGSFCFRLNNDGGSNYKASSNRDFAGSTYIGQTFADIIGCVGTMTTMHNSSGSFRISNANSTGDKAIELNFKGRLSDWITSTYVPDITETIAGAYIGTSAISSINMTMVNSNTFTAGTWKLWGVA